MDFTSGDERKTPMLFEGGCMHATRLWSQIYFWNLYTHSTTEVLK